MNSFGDREGFFLPRDTTRFEYQSDIVIVGRSVSEGMIRSDPLDLIGIGNRNVEVSQNWTCTEEDLLHRGLYMRRWSDSLVGRNVMA